MNPIRILAIALAASAASTSHTQLPTRIPDAPSCPRCTIRLTPIVLLGAPDGPGSLRGHGLLKLDGRGRYWALHPPDLPVVFDSLGRPIQTRFRKGSGPGEFQGSAIPVPLPGDSTLAVDYGHASLLAPDLRYVRTIQLQQMITSGIVFRWPDRVVVNGQMRARSARPEPLSLVSLANNSETITKRFGAHPDEAPLQWNELRRSIVRAGDRLWGAENVRYRLTEWTPDGRLLRVLERRPDWFDHTRTDFGGPNRAPREYVNSISLDERGLIWVFVNVAAPTWREAWPKLPPRTTEVSVDAIQEEKLYSTIVEVIDPARQRVVARTTINQYISASFPGRRAAIYQTDSEGIPRFSIVRLTLEGLPSAR